jgi:hypothetical protein
VIGLGKRRGLKPARGVFPDSTVTECDFFPIGLSPCSAREWSAQRYLDGEEAGHSMLVRDVLRRETTHIRVLGVLMKPPVGRVWHSMRKCLTVATSGRMGPEGGVAAERS